MTYCKARNQARRATRQALKAFEKEVARCAKTNPKKFYKYINSRTKVRVGISELHTADRRAISDEEKATALNDFFVSVFTNEDTNPPTCEMHPVDTPCPDLKLTHEQVHDVVVCTTVAKRVKVSRSRSSASKSSQGDGRYDYSPIC